MESDTFFEALSLATDTSASADVAPARLKSRIYSTLVQQLAADGPLLSLSATRAQGHSLCVFEAAVCLAPVGGRVESMNPCRVCHARVLGERLEHAPIYWPHCPYAEFHQR